KGFAPRAGRVPALAILGVQFATNQPAWQRVHVFSAAPVEPGAVVGPRAGAVASVDPLPVRKCRSGAVLARRFVRAALGHPSIQIVTVPVARIVPAAGIRGVVGFGTTGMSAARQEGPIAIGVEPLVPGFVGAPGAVSTGGGCAVKGAAIDRLGVVAMF